ncbi:MAG: tRNA (guanosine(46)-N7)-methyltransferase TrmB [Bacilli bacterium]
MRLRNNPHAYDELVQTNLLITQYQDHYFTNNNPIHLEIGCGKGDFIVGMALLYPEINFIAVEKYATVLEKAAKKIKKAKLNNVLILNVDALELNEYFSSNSLDTIYINFSDPWPKARHASRRLTNKKFLTIYQDLLKDDGLLKQKTDNVSLFESSLLSYHEYPVEFVFLSLDLHKNKDITNNVMSEYEQKFSKLGQPIFSAWTRFTKEGE